MLVSLKQDKSLSNPVISCILGHMTQGDNFKGPKQIELGCYQITHHSGDMIIWGSNAPKLEYGYPEFEGELSCYGVCDTPKQFYEDFGDRLTNDPRPLTVFFTHIKKYPENKGQGGGWRWHKWGPYVGYGIPTCEYLDDEELFENGVYTYHIYQVGEPE